MASPHLSWGFALRIVLSLFLLAAIATVFISLPVEKMSKAFLSWMVDLGPFGPVILSIANVPLAVLVVPTSVLTLGGGYLFELLVGLLADSTGATIGATVAFILERTIGRSFFLSRLKNYRKFQVVAVAIERSGFKLLPQIVLLLRLVPFLPFNMLNYLLSVTPIHAGEYIAATWLGMMPSTFALVYLGTTLKDFSDVTHGWNEFSTADWVFMAIGIAVSVILVVCITKVAKASLDKALGENARMQAILSPSMLPITADSASDIQKPFIITIDSSRQDSERQNLV